MGGIYEVRRCDGSRCLDIDMKCQKDWFRRSEVDKREFIDTQTYRHKGSKVIS
jgi:hypothetical protein